MSNPREVETFGASVEQSINNFNELKVSQKFGSDSVLINLARTNNTWDVVDDFMSGSNSESRWVVTFTPTTTQTRDYYCEFGFDWQITLNASSFDEYNLDTYDDPSTVGAGTGVKKFVVAYMNSLDDQRMRLKFSIKSAINGTLSWTRTL